MKITILSGLSETITTLPDKNSKIIPDISSDTIKRVGKIISDAQGYSVAFQLPELQVYNHTGFPDRQSAVKYEQDILDKHLSEVINIV